MTLPQTVQQTVQQTLHVARRRASTPVSCQRGGAALLPGRVPRVARLLALALRLEQLLHHGTVASYAELARLGRVSSARISQIMNLRWLAPDIQEALLFLPPVPHGRARLTLAHLQHVAAALDWPTQRQRWHALRLAVGPCPDHASDLGAPCSDHDPHSPTGACSSPRSADHAPG
jgi:hypothetical protein